MKVLMISTDRKIFENGSAVQSRIIEYGGLVEELHIIVFSGLSQKLLPEGCIAWTKSPRPLLRFATGEERPPSVIFSQIPNSNVYLYSTNSKNRWFYIFDAVKIAKAILGRGKLKVESGKSDFLVTTQDAFETGLVGWLIARKTSAKLQLQIHTDFLSKYFRKESTLNRVRVEMAKFLIPKADGIRVVSGRIKRSIIGHGIVKQESKISVLPIFVDIENIKNIEPKFDLHQKYPQFDFIFLVASRLEKEKNVDLIIKTFAEVVKKHPKAGLVIVGDGSQKNKFQLLTTHYSLQTNIVFEGWQEDLISYYKTADLFLSTSSYEGFGMTLVEAGISSCPILTTSVGVVGEILNEENSLICDVNDKKCFTEKMIYAVENIKQLKDFSQKAQQSIESNLVKDKQKYLEEYKKSWESCFNK